MKVELSQSLILKLTFSLKPTTITNGRIISTVPNDQPYMITDSHRAAPIGFGVRVGKTKKVYFVQRKVGGKLIKTNVGNVGDFPSIDEARSRAQELVRVAIDTGRNPSEIAAERNAAEITLKEAFDDYEAHLRGRKKPATDNTFKVLRKAREKLSSWSNRRVRDIRSKEILERFDEIAEKYRTSAEQTFRWANVAVEHAIKLEAHDAASANREPTLTHNPFGILKIQQKYRTRVELEEAYAKKGVRNPLSPDDTLGAFLDAVWQRRKQPLNRTGCDYLLFTLVFGNRKNESAKVKWRDRISDKRLITDALDSVRGKRGKFQLIITGHEPNYKNDFAYFPSYVVAREIGGNLMYAESETRRLLAPEEVGSRLGAMEVSSFHKLTDAA